MSAGPWLAVCALAAAAGGPVDAGPALDAGPVEPPPAFLDVRWDAAGLHTGRAERIEVRAPVAAAAIQALSGTLDKQALITLAASPDRRTWFVLAPVDVDAKPGARLLDLRATLADGSQLAFIKPVPIVEAPYDERQLSVDKRFVQPKKKDRLRAAREAKELARVLRASGPERLWRGSFAKPAQGEETSPFGTRRTYNKRTRSRHLGWDLNGAVGDPIVAMGRGKVVLSSERFYSGGTVVIDHGQGLFSMYFHMSRRDVPVGRMVEKGEWIGLIGATGRVTGPHLHFTVKMAGMSIDPKYLLALDLSADAEDSLERPAVPASAGAQPRQTLIEPGDVEEQQRDVADVEHVP
jgi:murein DD-endopeptidase MepM/ murein hydrolase activator NlpD